LERVPPTRAEQGGDLEQSVCIKGEMHYDPVSTCSLQLIA